MDVLDAADFILLEGGETNVYRLCCLLYFAQALRLVESRGRETLFDSAIEACPYGIRIPAVLDRYGMDFLPVPKPKTAPEISERDACTIRKVLDQFGGWSREGLARLAVRQAPWRTAFRISSGAEIRTAWIADWFLSVD